MAGDVSDDGGGGDVRGAGGGLAAGSYSGAIGQQSEELSFFNISLKKTKQEANLWLTPKEQSRLVMKKFGIPRANIKRIDAGKFGYITVTLVNDDPDKYKVPIVFDVKEGVQTFPQKVAIRPRKVTVRGAGFGNEAKVISMLEHFGTIESEITYEKFEIKENDDDDVKQLYGIENGDMSVMMKVKTNIPSYGLLEDGTRVSIRYTSQSPTCSLCHQTFKGCKGKAKARLFQNWLIMMMEMSL